MILDGRKYLIAVVLKMTIDKFGHHVHRQTKTIDTNIFLMKSEDGSFDIQSSKLIGLRTPTSEDEAVNKQYVDEIFERYNSKHEEIQSELHKIKILLKVVISKIQQ